MHVYRVQPIGLPIAGHYSETSFGEKECGCRVFVTLADLARGVTGWTNDGSTPEIVTIECDEADIYDNEDYDNEDYEGVVLVGSAGLIIHRRPFPSWAALYAWAAAYGQ